MELYENFGRLKQTLADLGFTSPELENSIRENLTKESERFTAYFRQQHAYTSVHICFEIGVNDIRDQFDIQYTEASLIQSDQGNGKLSNQTSGLFDHDVDLPTILNVLSSDLCNSHNTINDNIWGLSKSGAAQYLRDNNPDNIDFFKLLNQTNMNQNVEFLKNSLLNLGFGEKLNAEMEKQINAKNPEFNLATQQEYNQHKMDYTLHFKAGNNQDMYFLNKFDATMQSGKENMTQSFYINKGNGVTAKEAFNLMDRSDGLDGRAVFKQLFNKDQEKYHAWVKLDWKDLTEGGNARLKQHSFDVEKFLDGKGIKEMNDPETRENLIRSLKKGNKQQITVEKGGSEQKYFISANPQFKTVNLFDHQMKKMKREELFPPAQKQGNDQKQSAQQKEEVPEKKQSRKSSVKI